MEAKREIVFLRRPKVEARMALKRTSIQDRVRARTLTKPVSIGRRAVAWPEHEIEAVNAAILAGKSDDELRELVAKLEAARKVAA